MSLFFPFTVPNADFSAYKVRAKLSLYKLTDITMPKKKTGPEDEYQIIPENDPTNVFSTYDLGVSAALLCLGFKLLDVDKENPRKALFIFEREDGIEDFANQYFTDQLEVRARLFFDHLKALKNRLYS